jgi:RNA-directed DNA polymerase
VWVAATASSFPYDIAVDTSGTAYVVDHGNHRLQKLASDGQIEKRTALLKKLKETFQRLRSQPADEVIAEINPILRGWVNYFAMGHSSRCFSHIRSWVEKKIRCHLAKAGQRRGFGWKRWSTGWLYGELGLFTSIK